MRCPKERWVIDINLWGEMKGIGIYKQTRLKLSIPHWPELLRRKILWGIASGVVLIIAAGSMLVKDDTAMLLADGKPLAVVASETQVKEALAESKEQAEEEYGIPIVDYTTKLTYDKNAVANWEKPIEKPELVRLLRDNLDWQVKSWAIRINGNSLLFLSSREEADKALDSIKNHYLPEQTDLTVENIGFQETVSVEEETTSLKNLKTTDLAMEAMIKGLDKIIQYEIQKGDSLWTIARNNDLSVEELKDMNPQVKGELLKPGQVLNLVKAEPLVTVVSTVVTTVEERVPYKTVYENDSTLWRGQTRVKQEGVDGSREVTYRITKTNDMETGRETVTEKRLLEPVSRIVRQGTKAMVASRGDGGNGVLAWPTRGRITSGYGYRGREFHTGIDIDGLTGDPIYSAGNGVVIMAGWAGHYGKCIVVDHGNGLATRYGHLNDILVSVGQEVTRGGIIGRMGSTGRSTGSHLHFEVSVNDNHKNPLGYLER